MQRTVLLLVRLQCLLPCCPPSSYVEFATLKISLPYHVLLTLFSLDCPRWSLLSAYSSLILSEPPPISSSKSDCNVPCSVCAPPLWLEFFFLRIDSWSIWLVLPNSLLSWKENCHFSGSSSSMLSVVIQDPSEDFLTMKTQKLKVMFPQIPLYKFCSHGREKSLTYVNFKEHKETYSITKQRVQFSKNIF